MKHPTCLVYLCLLLRKSEFMAWSGLGYRTLKSVVTIHCSYCEAIMMPGVIPFRLTINVCLFCVTVSLKADSRA